MSRSAKSVHRSRSLRGATLLLAALAGVAVAALVGVALAKSFTLRVAKVKVAGNAESIVVNSHGVTVYTLSGESTHHLLCTSSSCLQFWPPLKVGAKTKLTAAPGVKGKLGRLHRNGFFQLTLAGHPLYRFMPDNNKPGAANGEGIKSFGGTWHVVKASSVRSGATPGTNTTAPATTTTTTTMPCLYPPC